MFEHKRCSLLIDVNHYQKPLTRKQEKQLERRLIRELIRESSGYYDKLATTSAE